MYGCQSFLNCFYLSIIDINWFSRFGVFHMRLALFHKFFIRDRCEGIWSNSLRVLHPDLERMVHSLSLLLILLLALHKDVFTMVLFLKAVDEQGFILFLHVLLALEVMLLLLPPSLVQLMLNHLARGDSKLPVTHSLALACLNALSLKGLLLSLLLAFTVLLPILNCIEFLLPFLPEVTIDLEFILLSFHLLFFPLIPLYGVLLEKFQFLFVFILMAPWNFVTDLVIEAACRYHPLVLGICFLLLCPFHALFILQDFHLDGVITICHGCSALMKWWAFIFRCNCVASDHGAWRMHSNVCLYFKHFFLS